MPRLSTIFIALPLEYSAKEWNFEIEFKHVGENFRAETGFVPRTGFNTIELEGGKLFFPKNSSKIVSHGRPPWPNLILMLWSMPQ